MIEIQVKNYSKIYDGRKIIDLASITIHSGTLTVFSGENGSGKTTLAKSIASLVLPDEGEVIVFKNGKKLKKIQPLIYYTFESGRGFYPYLSSRQNLQYFLRISGIRLRKNDPEMTCLTEQFSFTPFMDTKVNKLSQGNRQKLALLLALRSGKEILIFDEPTNGLDKESIDIFITKITDLVRTKIIIITSHEEKLLKISGNRVFHFKQGCITESEG